MSNEGLDQLWVEPVGGIIIARLRGVATADLIQECHKRIVDLQGDTGCKLVMYDALELERPPIDIVIKQQGLTDGLKQADVKVAIVVPNTGIAYLSRLAFGEANHRVFYNDIAAALSWLSSD